jgi:hypothetical protein
MRMTVFSLIALLVFGAPGGIAALQAAQNMCKGLATETCTGNQGCSWVKPHKAKSGKDIAGFCRKKPARSSAVKASDMG